MLSFRDRLTWAVQGLVDLDVEIAKCEKKRDLARMNLQKIVKVEAQADYAETVPENVRGANEEKVSIGASLCVESMLIGVCGCSARRWRRRWRRLSFRGRCLLS